MKKIPGLLALATIFMISCTDQPVAESKKEVTVVPAKTQTVTPPPKTTSVTLDKNGVKVETKKVDVTVKQ